MSRGALWDDVPGQDRAVAQLQALAAHPVHAYLLSGPPGVGMREAARAFSAALTCADAGCGECRDCRRGLDEAHPDITWVERVGASISKEQIDEVIRVSARAPAEGRRAVIVLVDFHLIAQQYPRLLKTLEEPPAATVFVLLADDVPPELVTVASRCVRIELGPLTSEVIAERLVAEGVDRSVAEEVATAAGGRIDRARLLVGDEGFRSRRAAWHAAPDRLDGTGAAVMALADELRAAIDGVLEPLAARQADEMAALEVRLEQTGERATVRKDLEDRHKREQRRVRTDELRFGLATLAGAYRDALAAGEGDERASIEAVAAIQAAAEAMVRNPTETLLLQSLLLRLPPLRGRRAILDSPPG